MNRCLISYKTCGDALYSPVGLHLLSPRLNQLQPFAFSAEAQRREAALRMTKLSIQGVQPKLSARLNVAKKVFEVVERRGRYIIKPQHEHFPSLPENEAITMRLAASAGIEVPVHGLLHCVDGTLSYFIRRFDRLGHKTRLPVEDFAQLGHRRRDTKYDSSLEQVAQIVERYCSFPIVEKRELLKRCLFNFLAGNEDMHLKNFSVITRDGRVTLAPAYDFLNTTLAYESVGKRREDVEESALPVRGKKKNLTRSLWVDYFARERLGLNARVIDDCLAELFTAVLRWPQLLAESFLPAPAITLYRSLLEERKACLKLT